MKALLCLCLATFALVPLRATPQETAPAAYAFAHAEAKADWRAGLPVDCVAVSETCVYSPGERTVFHYPPFCRLSCLGLTGEDREATERAARQLLKWMKDRLREHYPTMPVRLLGLSQGAVFRVAGRYRFKILVKTARSPQSRAFLSESLEEAGKLLPKGASAFIQARYDSEF